MVTPLLLILMFGALETGKFFLDEHIVVKAVRDGARFAARQPFADMPCEGETAVNEDAIKKQVLYGKPTATDSDTPRLSYWTDADSVIVTIECIANDADPITGVRDYAGIYTERDDVPHVTVSATVGYQPLVSMVGLDLSGLNLVASNQAPVFGV